MQRPSTEVSPPVEAAGTLTTLAQEIQDEHLMCEQAAERAVDHAIKAGELLTKAKAQVEHGEWLPWLADNFEFSQQTASEYVRISENYGGARNLPPSVRAAIAEIGPAHPRSDAPDPDDEPEVVEGELVEPTPIGVRKHKHQTRLVDSVVSRVEGISMSLGEVDLAVIHQIIPEQKGEEWAQQLRSGRTAISQLISALER